MIHSWTVGLNTICVVKKMASEMGSRIKYDYDDGKIAIYRFCTALEKPVIWENYNENEEYDGVFPSQ